MSSELINIPFDILEKFIFDAFVSQGVPEEHAAVCADVIITADKRGIDSHGAGRFKNFYYDRIKEGTQMPITNFEIINNGPTTAVIDGHNGMGQYIAKRSMDMAIEKAGKYGLGMVVVRNSSHYGIAGYYVLQAVNAGMIGITGTNARPSVAPTFGVENMFGTNPLTFGMPSDDPFPFVLDCATSLAQRAKIEVYDRLNKPLPESWVVSEDGKPCIDAHIVLEDLLKGKAALTPLGGISEDTAGYKGFGYAAVVEILCASLQSGNFLKMLSGFQNGKKVPCGIGHFFIAINIESFIELDIFKKNTGDILRELRNSKKMPGADRIYTAGEKEYLTYLERKDKGAPLTDVTLNELRIVREEQKLFSYNF